MSWTTRLELVFQLPGGRFRGFAGVIEAVQGPDPLKAMAATGKNLRKWLILNRKENNLKKRQLRASPCGFHVDEFLFPHAHRPLDLKK
jgi:hypothetical protein